MKVEGIVVFKLFIILVAVFRIKYLLIKMNQKIKKNNIRRESHLNRRSKKLNQVVASTVRETVAHK